MVRGPVEHVHLCAQIKLKVHFQKLVSMENLALHNSFFWFGLVCIYILFEEEENNVVRIFSFPN
jgi:hypothetical protein